jgi:hypothetical protein
MQTVHPLVRKTLAFIVAIVVVVSVVQAVLIKPAHASFSWCTSANVVCFAEHNDGNGIRWTSNLLPVGQCYGVPSSLNDKISSLWNKYTSSGARINAYLNNPCSGFLYGWGPGAFVPWIGSNNNDKISAVCLGPRGGSVGCP